MLTHKSKDGDMGFPGKVQATAVFELVENRLTIDYRAKVNAPTPVNLTNHAYWNLAGSGNLDHHTLMVAAPTYVVVDDAKIPVPGPPQDVADSRFDCRVPRSLSAAAADGGYDHCFVLDADAEVHASLQHESGRRLDISTNQTGLQVYLDPDRRGVALEAQCLPDTPNRPDFGEATVRPGDNYLARTELTFTA